MRNLESTNFLSGLEPAERRHWDSLRRERDPELRAAGLLAWAGRLENRHREAEALQIYRAILEGAPAGTPGVERAQRRLEALQGRGPLGERVEVSARNFFSQASDPAMIFGFLAAGSVTALTRGFVGRSLALAAESAWSRGWRARALAGGTAYLAEVPAFVFGTRLARGILGYEGGFGEAATLPLELAGTALFLGGLKLSGAARLGSLAGAYLGHRAEEAFGLRPGRDEASRWFEAGETFLQLRAGGAIAAALLSGGRRVSPLREAGGEPALQASAWRFAARSELRPLDLAAAIRPEDEITQPYHRQEIDAALLQGELQAALGPRATSRVVQSVQALQAQTQLGPALIRMLNGSQYGDVAGFELALRRLNYAANYALPGGLRGSYLNGVVRAGLETTVQQQDQARFDRLLALLAEGGNVDRLESLVSELDPWIRLIPEEMAERQSRLNALAAGTGESHRLIRLLPLPREARQVLHAYDGFAPERDRLRSPRVVQAWLEKYPQHRALVVEALRRARLNPAGALRVQRMIRILTEEPAHLAKLRELADMDLGIRLPGQPHPFHDAESILGSQDDGYLAAPELAQELAQLYRRLPELLDGERAAARRSRTQGLLGQVWPDNRRPVDSASLRTALLLLGDPVSESIESDLAAERFRLVFLPRNAFDALFTGVDSRRRSFSGLFVPAFQDASGRDSIYLMQVEAASHQAYRDLAFLRLVQLVHEHAHFQRASRQSNRGLNGTYLEEMLAEARAFRWQAEHGDKRLLDQYLAVHPAGLGLYLRDWVNWTYFTQ